MGLSCGIVGLPNVGKSTIFNALTRSAAALAANYPFATIEPNVGDVPVPDPRLEVLAAIEHSKRIVNAAVRFVDIAGLVRGASSGAGLGNAFLAHIRETDAIAMVVRCFEDPNVSHVEGEADPARDMDIIATEMALADLATLTKRIERLEPLLAPAGLLGELPLTEERANVVLRGREQVHAILDGDDDRLIVVGVGPLRVRDPNQAQ